MILDPWGETLASLGGEDHAAVHATLEMDTVTEIRALNPLATVRRFSIAWDH
jgi:predicted amidohydrolase